MSEYTRASANAVRTALLEALLDEISPDARVGYDHRQFATDYADWLIDNGWVTREPV